MSKNKNQNLTKEDDVKTSQNQDKVKNKETSIEDRLKETEEKLLRSLAEIENQRRRFEKEIKDVLNLDLLILLKKA